MTVEILVKEVFRRPLRQVDVQTLADVVAVSEVQTFSKATLKGLSDFLARARAEIADLPNGQPVRDFLSSLEGVEPERASRTLRDLIADEAVREGRAVTHQPQFQKLLDLWSSADPEPVTLGVAAPQVVRGAAEPLRDKRIGGKVEDPPPEAARAPRSRASSSSSTASPHAQSARPPKPVANPQRDLWIRQQVMTKLGSSSSGLAEVVLVAGIVHMGKDKWPGLSAMDVKGVLQQMKNSGAARVSAGRWSGGKRW